jgi:hypothetical protein
MHIPRRCRHCRCCCRCRGNLSLPHHHVSFFVVAAAVTVAFATVAVIAAIAAEVPQLSSPQSSTLGDCRPSVIVSWRSHCNRRCCCHRFPCYCRCRQCCLSRSRCSGGLSARPSTTSTPRHLRTSNYNNQLKVTVEEGAGLLRRR